MDKKRRKTTSSSYRRNSKSYDYDEDDTRAVNYNTKNNKHNGKNKKASKKSKHPKLKKFILIFIAVCVVLGLALVGVLAGIFFSDKWAIADEDLSIKTINTTVLDKEGNKIAELTGDEKRIIVPMDQMAEKLPKAFVAIEDERFYQHKGVDVKRTAAATVTFLIHRGDSSFGGSTITQQLVKNLMKDDSDSGAAGVERKIREMSRAKQIEKKLTKDQILELYLNLIFMGDQYYGVEMASKFYFNKSAKDLTITECAFLAGINHSPNNYNPYKDDSKVQDRIKTRTKTVLGKMKELGYINNDEYNTSISEVDAGITFTKGSTNTNTTYSYHTSAAIKEVIRELMDSKDLNEEAAKMKLYGGGYTIYTTQDTTIQNRMEEEFQKDKYLKYSKTVKDENGKAVHSQAAMAIIDQTTGQVVGVMGSLGTDANAATGLNRATQSVRQIGSTMKPIGVVAPALEAGVITAGTVFDDSPTKFGDYTPKNSTGYQGLATVRTGIEVSSNIMNLKIMALLGPSNSIKFLQKAGVTTIDTERDNSLPLALGGLDKGMTILETAGVYAMIANDGEYIEPTFFTKVVDSNGNTVLETTQRRERCMSVENAYIMKEILTAPVTGNGGTATTCSISGMEVGAKTGSTDDNKDRWLCGITPYYTGACWYGFDQPEQIYFSGNPSAKLWSSIMKDIHKDLEGKKFVKPDNVVTARICRDSGKVATNSCTRVYTEYFVKGTVPSACDGHKTYTICKESGKLATEFCKDTETVSGLSKPDTEKNPSWQTSYGGKYTEKSEYCDIHTSESSESKPEESSEKVKVPDVIGMTKANAKSAIESRGLKFDYTTTAGTADNDGTVKRANITAGNEVEKGTTITVTIYKYNAESENTTHADGGNDILNN